MSTANVPRSRSLPTGFSLLEILVATLLLSLVLAGVVALLRLSLAATRSQSSIADLQQSVRTSQHEIVRLARMAGRGGLERGPLPRGLAIAVRNNAPTSGPDAHIARGDPGSPRVLPGSDVLTVRGVFSTPLFQVSPTPGALALVGEPASHGSVQVHDLAPSGIPQDLGALEDAVRRGRPEALLIVSPLGASHYAVVELAGGSVESGRSATLHFRIRGGVHTSAYTGLSPGGAFPESLGSIWQVGLLEEHRFYVHSGNDPAAGPGGSLMRARFYPGSESAYAGAASNLSLAIADRILDLQIALGIDTDLDGEVVEADPPSGGDEWLFNSQTDAPDDAGWNRTIEGRSTRLFFVRVTLVGRGTHREPGHLSSPLGRLEDRPAAAAESTSARSYRHWVLTTTAEPRNLS